MLLVVMLISTPATGADEANHHGGTLVADLQAAKQDEDDRGAD